MTTYLAWPERCKDGNNNNHVVMKCCIEYGTIEAESNSMVEHM